MRKKKVLKRKSLMETADELKQDFFGCEENCNCDPIENESLRMKLRAMMEGVSPLEFVQIKSYVHDKLEAILNREFVEMQIEANIEEMEDEG